MDITHYAFALFVFLLACGLIWFYGRVAGKDKKKDRNEYEKEQRLFKLYQDVEDLLNGFEAYTEEAKAGIDERLRKAEALALSAGKNPAAKAEPTENGAAAFLGNPVEEIPPEAEQPPKIVQDVPVKVKKTQKKQKQRVEDLVPRYLSEGMSREDVAKSLGISSREVSLIMEIKKLDPPGKEN